MPTLDPVTKQYLQAKMRYATLDSITQKALAQKRATDTLSALGQGVTKDDVFKEVMGIIQGGHSSGQEVTKDLVTMPPGGPALAEWIGAKSKKIDGVVAKLAPAMEQARMALGQASFQKMMMHMAGQGGGEPAPMAPPASPVGVPNAS